MSTLTATGITWTKHSRRILDDVSLEARSGAVLGLLGPNGAGKTSLLRILAGLRRPDSGTVRVDGTAIERIPRRRLARSLAIVEQLQEVHEDMTVEEAIALGRTPYRGTFEPLGADDRAAVEHALGATGMSAHRSRSWRTLSGGERQRAQFGRALAQQPRIVVLDEPTNHLDIRYQLDVLEMLRDESITVVAALHDLNLAARFCDRIVVLRDGEVCADGTPEDVVTPALIDDVYGVTAVVEQSPHTQAPIAVFLRVAR
ncbi:ABC transporter ATP-binding protein [Leucobacter chromiiresistens]|uniref:Histidinol phosphatase n=1 Tax=Leucobacter chromiiresistens TaxID=1079994 RepID=A0A147ELD6_9MICO|nr:ABC transporter ATP-binding protein [Leucobacter chromiiresistens]KTR85283.1 histidinol phosphatase [Leucobacter chromiiresistens]